MPYRKQLNTKGARESLRLWYLKICWFFVHYDDVTDDISKKYFVENFFEIAKDMGLFEKIEEMFGVKWQWFNEDGTLKEYDYDYLQKNSIFKRYGWYDQYPVFKTDMLQKTKDTSRERFERSIDNWVINYIKEFNQLCVRIAYLQELQEGGLDYDKEIKRNESSKSMVIDNLKKLLGLDEINLNLDGTIDMEAYITEGTYSPEEILDLQSVSSKPDESTQRFLDQL